MPFEIPCPSCNRRLRLEGDVIGRMVKCPSCATTFTAMALEPATDRLDGQGRQESTEATNPDALPRADERESISQGLGQAGWYQGRDGEEGDDRSGTGRWDDDEDHPFRFDRIAGARSTVAGPAIALMVFGWLHLAGIVLVAGYLLYLNILTGVLSRDPAPVWGGLAGYTVLGSLFSGLIVYGARKMKRLESYGWAMTASILAILCALSSGVVGVIGVVVGIWAVVVLLRTRVKAAFR